MTAGETHVHFRTTDDTALDGDLVVPDVTRAAAIVCHPHPQYGGNRFNHVVAAFHRVLPDAGIASLRFDFRPEFDDGHGERLDATAALGELRRRTPDVALFAVGYSFGALIALALDDTDLAGKVLVAPPLTAIDGAQVPTAATLVLSPEHDQFTSAAQAATIAADWPRVECRKISGADHFLTSEADETASASAEWILQHLHPPQARDT